MRIKLLEITLDLEIFHDVLASESRKGLHAKEVEVHVHREEKIVDAFTLKQELIRIIKTITRGVERNGKHVFPPK